MVIIEFEIYIFKLYLWISLYYSICRAGIWKQNILNSFVHSFSCCCHSFHLIINYPDLVQCDYYCFKLTFKSTRNRKLKVFFEFLFIHYCFSRLKRGISWFTSSRFKFFVYINLFFLNFFLLHFFWACLLAIVILSFLFWSETAFIPFKMIILLDKKFCFLNILNDLKILL